MKIKISNVLIETQERLLGFVTEMSYGYAQLCVKADPSSLLGFEETVDGKTCKMEELARVLVHDEEGDDDKIDLYPIEIGYIQTLITGMMKVHPEFKITMEKYEEAEEDDESPELKFIRLTMPKVNKERRDFMLTAIDALDTYCKGRLEKMRVKYSAQLTKVCLGEKPEAVDEAKRCLNCKNRPCVGGCPVQIDIPSFISKVAEGEFEEAYGNGGNCGRAGGKAEKVCGKEDHCQKDNDKENNNEEDHRQKDHQEEGGSGKRLSALPAGRSTEGRHQPRRRRQSYRFNPENGRIASHRKQPDGH